MRTVLFASTLLIYRWLMFGKMTETDGSFAAWFMAIFLALDLVELTIRTMAARRGSNE